LHEKGSAVKKGTILACILFILLLATGPARGHFGMMIPSDSMILQGEDRTVTLALSFSHPFEGQGMEMDKPRTFGVLINGQRHNLLGNLSQTQVMQHTAWSAQFKSTSFSWNPNPTGSPLKIRLLCITPRRS
jgi:cobalt/nickel transport protein